ncbi:MAG: hypothetical protein HYZ15_10675 [Sphingobacteriales bacterium]|nr:hypothetical protein [Sphingobacteriales bacterium]
MRKLIFLLPVAAFLTTTGIKAQTEFSFARTDSLTYALYQRAEWKSLLQYGKEAINHGQDFILLRLRTGLAAFMLGNYSEAIRQYEAVLREDAYNSTAHYYIYYCRMNLNQPELALSEARYLPDAAVAEKETRPAALTHAGLELSVKYTSVSRRGNSFYSNISFGNRLGRGFHIYQSVAVYRQMINEPLLPAVVENNRIQIRQTEYYNRLLFNLGRHWQVKTAYHYLNTPFSNFNYHNHLLLLGAKYYGDYLELQADIVLGKLTGSSVRQYNLQLGLYPKGNMGVYGFSTATIRQQGQSAFNFRQVLGVRVLKQTWLEGHITAGGFSNLAENDALYVYHAIDPNKSKAGLTAYLLLKGGLKIQAGYTYEQRRLYGTVTNFSQHSITGGISWKF